MKKLLVFLITVVILCLSVGCKSTNATNNSNPDKIFSQTMTIVKMPSPSKCKTVDDMSTIDEALEIISEIKKGKKLNDSSGWQYMIKLNIDGSELVYTIGDIFTDVDGSQYEVLNLNEINGKLDSFYDEINVEETDYK